MNVDTRPVGETTSAGGPMIDRGYRAVWARITGCILAEPGTSAGPVDWVVGAWNLVWRQTSGGASVLRKKDHAGGAIAELRRLSGLTWAQLARLFGVTRRSLHFWASGKPLTPANEERLNRMLATVRKVNRGSAIANRTLLLAADGDGQIAFDMLAEGRYEDVISLLGAGGVAPRSVGNRPSSSVQAARTPPAPDRFLNARQDRIHVEKPRLVSAKPIRVPRGK